MADDETKDQTPREEDQKEKEEDKKKSNEETKQDDEEEDDGRDSRNPKEEKGSFSKTNTDNSTTASNTELGESYHQQSRNSKLNEDIVTNNTVSTDKVMDEHVIHQNPSGRLDTEDVSYSNQGNHGNRKKDNVDDANIQRNDNSQNLETPLRDEDDIDSQPAQQNTGQLSARNGSNRRQGHEMEDGHGDGATTDDGEGRHDSETEGGHVEATTDDGEGRQDSEMEDGHVNGATTDDGEGRQDSEMEDGHVNGATTDAGEGRQDSETEDGHVEATTDDGEGRQDSEMEDNHVDGATTDEGKGRQDSEMEDGHVNGATTDDGEGRQDSGTEDDHVDESTADDGEGRQDSETEEDHVNGAATDDGEGRQYSEVDDGHAEATTDDDEGRQNSETEEDHGNEAAIVEGDERQDSELEDDDVDDAAIDEGEERQDSETGDHANDTAIDESEERHRLTEDDHVDDERGDSGRGLKKRSDDNENDNEDICSDNTVETGSGKFNAANPRQIENQEVRETSPLEDDAITSGQPPASTSLEDGVPRKKHSETEVAEERSQEGREENRVEDKLVMSDTADEAAEQSEVNILKLDDERVESSSIGSPSGSVQSFTDVPLPQSSSEAQREQESPPADTPTSPERREGQVADDTDNTDQEAGDNNNQKRDPVSEDPQMDEVESSDEHDVNQDTNAEENDRLDNENEGTIKDENDSISEQPTEQSENSQDRDYSRDTSTEGEESCGTGAGEKRTEAESTEQGGNETEQRKPDILILSNDTESFSGSSDNLNSPRPNARSSETDVEVSRGEKEEEEQEEEETRDEEEHLGDADVEDNEEDVYTQRTNEHDTEISEQSEDENESRETDPDKRYYNKEKDDEQGEDENDTDDVFVEGKESGKVDELGRSPSSSELEIVEMDNEIRGEGENQEVAEDEAPSENEKIKEQSNSNFADEAKDETERKNTDDVDCGETSSEDGHGMKANSANNGPGNVPSERDNQKADRTYEDETQDEYDSHAVQDYERVMAEDTFETGSSTSANRKSRGGKSYKESQPSTPASQESNRDSLSGHKREPETSEPRKKTPIARRSKTAEPQSSPGKKNGDERRTSQSAKTLLRKRQKTASSRTISSRPQTTKSCQDGRSKQKEFFKEELRRLEKSLTRESSKIHKPPVKKYIPYVFNNLEPYYNTHTAKYLIELPDEVRHGYISRSTAAGLCDPWVDLRMDRDILPRIDSRPVTRAQSKTGKRSPSKEKEKDKRPPKEGSTRLPKFPVVALEANELTNRQLFYNDVPELRQELKQKYSTQAQKKIDDDYKRTKQDYYRMELDKMDEIHPINRPNMRKAYFAYLQNTPGSRKAIYSCVRKSEKASQ